MVGYGGKDLRKRKVLSLEWKSEGMMDDESGESMEPIEEVPLIQLGEAVVGTVRIGGDVREESSTGEVPRLQKFCRHNC